MCFRATFRPQVALYRINHTQSTPIPQPRRSPQFMEKADAVVLCLPDDASIQANDWLNESGNDSTVLIDASTAFRVDPTFTYGFPELCKEQKVRRRFLERSKTTREASRSSYS